MKHHDLLPNHPLRRRDVGIGVNIGAKPLYIKILVNNDDGY